MLKRIQEIKEWLMIRKAYLTDLYKNYYALSETRAIDFQLKQLNDLIQNIQYNDMIPDSFEKFSSSDYLDKVMLELQSDFEQAQNYILNDFNKKEREIEDVIQLLSENVSACREIIKVERCFIKPIPTFYQETLEHLNKMCAIDMEIAKVILFQDDFEPFYFLILNAEERRDFNELRNFIKNQTCKSPKELAIQLCSKLKNNPKFLFQLKSSFLIRDKIGTSILKKYGTEELQKVFEDENFFDNQNSLERIQYFYYYYLEKKKQNVEERDLKLRQLQEQHEMNLKSWSKENLPNKYIELQEQIKADIYQKLNQIMTLEYGKNTVIYYGNQLEKALHEVYDFLVKKENASSMNLFYRSLFNMQNDIWDTTSKLKVEFPDMDEKNSVIKKKKSVIQKLINWKSFIPFTRKKKKEKKGEKLQHVPQFKEKQEFDKIYMKDQSLQILKSLQNQFSSMRYDLNWKQEMIQKFPILIKSEDDVTISDLKELPNFATLLLQEVKKQNIIASNIYQLSKVPNLPQENFFLSLFQRYLATDLNDLENLTSEDMEHFIQLLNGILSSTIHTDRFEKMENLTPEAIDQIAQAYFCAEDYVSRHRKK